MRIVLTDICFNQSYGKLFLNDFDLEITIELFHVFEVMNIKCFGNASSADVSENCFRAILMMMIYCSNDYDKTKKKTFFQHYLLK